MRGALRRRLAVHHGEAGLTLIEMLVAAAMSVALVGGATAMLISAVRQQPEQSERAQRVTTARWQLDRMTREIRNGVSVTTSKAKTTEVSFLARVRRTTCGGAVQTNSTTPAITCQITYTCTTTYCSRVEAAEGIFTGTSTKVATGIDSAAVFCYVPSTEPDPTKCGPAGTTPTYIGITLRIPSPNGENELTVSDGASLRAATFSD
jgi:Tfp pilus assembly protein PilW